MANPIDKQARQMANSALAPVLAEIQRQRAQEEQRAARAQRTASGSAAGLAEVLAGIAPQTQETYKQAGDSTAAYAKGFSAAFASDSDNAAAEINKFLGAQGSPQQVRAAGRAGGDALYATGGYIPASSLAREGAAFTSAAQRLPATARMLGQAEVNKLGAESRDRLSQLDALLRQEKGKLPGLVSDARAQLIEQQIKQRAAELNEIALRSQIGDREFKQGLAVEKLRVSQQNANTSANSVRLRAQKQQFDQALAGAKLKLAERDYELALQREQRLSKPAKKGGFTAKQKRDMGKQAVDTAGDDFYGYDDDPNQRRPPVESLRDMIAGGVPFSIAIRAIQRYARGKKPDNMDAKTWALWRATLGWTKKGKR